MPLAKKLRVPRKNKISIVRSTDAIFVLYRQIAASRLPQRYTRVGIYTEIPEVFLRLLPFRKKKNTVSKIPNESVRHPAIDRTSPLSRRKPSVSGRQSILRTFSKRFTHALVAQFFPTRHGASRHENGRDTIRRRIGITIVGNKCVYVIGCASKGASSLATPLPAQRRTKTTRRCLRTRASLTRTRVAAASIASPGNPRHPGATHRGGTVAPAGFATTATAKFFLAFGTCSMSGHCGQRRWIDRDTFSASATRRNPALVTPPSRISKRVPPRHQKRDVSHPQMMHKSEISKIYKYAEKKDVSP